MTVDDKNIQQPVVVKVQKTGSPGQKRNCRDRQTGTVGNIRKTVLPIIPVQRLVIIGKRCREQIDFPVPVVISHSNTHIRLLAPVLTQRKSRNVAYILKKA